ncbi:MAG: type II toxin-antitoxin system YoeB family toxin [Bacteroidales bacterium]|nr:type II toxin-antitoxin system YoeB family toxin [Bacteroidales bacterium]
MRQYACGSVLSESTPRLIYRVKDDEILIVKCRFHYD